jgi:hypothetical protein
MPISLPKIETPKYKLKIPSNNKVVEFRPYLVAEEKLLLIASESEDKNSILDAIKQIVQNCTFNKLDVEELTNFDLEYIFIKLRTKSVGEVSEMITKCSHCKKENEIGINLEKVEVVFPENIDKKIMITDTIGVEMRYPTVKDNEDIELKIEQFKSEVEQGMLAVTICIKSIFDEKNVYPREDYSEKELIEFLESLNHQQMNKIMNFVTNMPVTKLNYSFKCIHCKEENKRSITGLENFFG